MLDLVQVEKNIDLKQDLYVIKKNDFYIISNGGWVVSTNEKFPKTLSNKLEKGFEVIKPGIQVIRKGKIVHNEYVLEGVEQTIIEAYTKCRKFDRMYNINTGLVSVESEKELSIFYNEGKDEYVSYQRKYLDMVNLPKADVIVTGDGAREPLYCRGGVEEVIILPIIDRNKNKYLR